MTPSERREAAVKPTDLAGLEHGVLPGVYAIALQTDEGTSMGACRGKRNGGSAITNP